MAIVSVRPMRATGNSACCAGVVAIEQPGQRAVDDDVLQVDVRHAELRAERLPHDLVGRVAELQQRLAERELQLRLFGQRVRQLFGRDGAAGDENFAEPAAILGLLGGRRVLGCHVGRNDDTGWGARVPGCRGARCQGARVPGCQGASQPLSPEP